MLRGWEGRFLEAAKLRGWEAARLGGWDSGRLGWLEAWRLLVLSIGSVYWLCLLVLFVGSVYCLSIGFKDVPKKLQKRPWEIPQGSQRGPTFHNPPCLSDLISFSSPRTYKLPTPSFGEREEEEKVRGGGGRRRRTRKRRREKGNTPDSPRLHEGVNKG
jgi:hypothetical protein